MIYRIQIDRDTTISNYSNSNYGTFANSGASGNTGASQVLDVWGFYDITQNLKFIARSLVHADLTSLCADINAGVVPNPTTTPSMTANLVLFNINHGNTQAYGFNINVLPLTTQWQEGIGTKIDTFTDVGYANFLQPSATGSWTISGGDVIIDSNSSVVYFNTGYENLTANLKSLLVSWLNGTSANYGCMIKMDNVAESITGSNSSNIQYYRKAFHSRNTNYPTKAPYIELLYPGEIYDYRAIVKLGTTSNLFFYNFVNGVLTDIDGVTTAFPGYVTLSGSTAVPDSTLSSFTGISTLTNISASRFKQGVYQVNFTMPLTTSQFQYFSDIWTVTSSSSAVAPTSMQTFNITLPIQANDNYQANRLTLRLRNFSQNLDSPNIISQKIFIKQDAINLNPLTASVTSIQSAIVESGFYKILVNSTNETYIDWQPLEFDKNGNFFTINTNNYYRNVPYRIVFKLNVRGQTFLIDNITNVFQVN